MKTIKVPFCDKLDINDFSSLECRMELQGAKSYISQVNWPSEYPYVPTVSFTIARNTTHLVILYHVRGLDLRAYALTDNEMVCHDSCCEFFVSDPYDSTYYNFEMNCIGTVKAAIITRSISFFIGKSPFFCLLAVTWYLATII